MACVIFVSPLAQAVPVRAYESYVHGLLASREGDVERAIADYTRVLALDEKSPSVYRELALLYWQAGKHEEAMEAAARFASLSNDSVYTQLFLGSFYLMGNEPELARAAWEKALKMDPANESAILYLAAYHGVSEPEKAIEYWKRYIRLQPDSAEGYYQMGLVQEKLAHADLARAAFKKSLSLNPEFGDVYLAIAQLDEHDKDMSAAALNYEKYLTLDPDNNSVLLYLGGLYFRAKRYDDAERVFSRASLKQPNETNIQFWLGIIAENRKDWAAAIEHFERVRAKEETPILLARLSYYYSALKNYKKSVACLERAVMLDPANSNTYYLIGLAYMDLKKPAKAEKSFLSSIALRGDYSEVHFYLGVLYDQMGKFDKTEVELKKAIEIDPKYASAMNYLGYSYADRGLKLQEAQELIKRALAIDPNNAAYLDSMGWLLFRINDLPGAETVLEKAAAANGDATILDHLGDVKAKLGKNTDAWDAYRRSFEANPRDKKVAKKIKLMEKLVLPSTIQRKLLKRAISNLSQVSSLKTSFVATGSASDKNYRLVGVLQYSRPDRWRADILGMFLAPQIIVMHNAGSTEIFPKALQGSVAGSGIDVLDNVAGYFSAEIVKKFDTDSTLSRQSRGSIIYSLNGEQLIIDRENGAVSQYRGPSGLIVRFGKINWEEGLYLPHSINLSLPGEKIVSQIEIKSYRINPELPADTFSSDTLR